MHAGRLIFSRDARGSRLYRVSPLLFPQEQDFNKYHLPSERDLPDNLLTRFYPFDFGFSNRGLAVGPYDTAYFPIEMGANFLAEIITGCSAAAAQATPPAAGALAGIQVRPSYLVNFLHTHAGKTRQWANKSLTDVEMVGTGQDPMVFKSPVLIPKGDTLTCVIQNLANNTLQAQIVLTGGEF